MNRKRILWLVSWYPNRYDKFNGDFIQRHAQAASIYNDIYVIYLQGTNEIKNTEVEINKQQGLTEHIIYYQEGVDIIQKVLKQFRYFSLYRKAIQHYIQEYGLPHCVHVHVPWKAGLLALWLKKKYRVPYFITEHWGIYNKIVNDNYFIKPFYFRFLLARIFRHCEKIITVSKFIGRSINSVISKKEFVCVPNAVNTVFFKQSLSKYTRFTFLHVSNMVDIKNVEGILNAFYDLLNKVRCDIQLILVGNKDNYYEVLAERIGVPKASISFKGEVSYKEVAKEMQKAHCLILNSKIENSPCVIGEALCCGIPVISTNVGGVPGLVDNFNSILIRSESSVILSEAMMHIFVNQSSFSSTNIAERARRKFSYEKIGNELAIVYNSVVNE